MYKLKSVGEIKDSGEMVDENAGHSVLEEAKDRGPKPEPRPEARRQEVPTQKGPKQEKRTERPSKPQGTTREEGSAAQVRGQPA